MLHCVTDFFKAWGRRHTFQSGKRGSVPNKSSDKRKVPNLRRGFQVFKHTWKR